MPENHGWLITNYDIDVDEGESITIQGVYINATSSSVSTDNASVELTAFAAGSALNTSATSVSAGEYETGAGQIDLFLGDGPATTGIYTEESSTSPSIYRYASGSTDQTPTTDDTALGPADTRGLRNAIEDWRNNVITTATLRQVIKSWRNGRNDIRIRAVTDLSFSSVSGPGTTEVGDVLTWTMTLDNAGSVAETTSVRLRLNNNEVVETQAVEIPSGGSDTIEINFVATDTYLGSNSWTLEATGATSTGSVDIVASTDPGLVSLGIDSINQPELDGGTLRVNAAAENSGTSSFSDTVRLFVSGSQVASESVSLGAKDQDSVTLTKVLSPSSFDAGEQTLQIDFENTSGVVRTGTVEIIGEPGYQITAVDAPSESTAASFIEFDVTIENTGTDDLERILRLDWGSTNVDDDRTVPITVAAGQTRTVQVPYLIQSSDADSTVSWTLTTPTDTATGDIDVVEPADPDARLEIQDVERRTDEGGDVSVLVGVENQSATTLNDTVELVLAATVEDSASVSLQPGEEVSKRLTWADTVGEGGDNDALIRLDQDTASRITVFEVVARPILDIDSVSSPSQTDANTATDWDVTVENSGSAPTDVELALDFRRDGETVDEERFDFGATTTETLTLTTTPRRSDIGDQQWAVRLQRVDRGEPADTVTGIIQVIDPGPVTITDLTTTKIND